ncbi:hypothetical protein WDU94_008325 [Cyamophila willieti]
MESNNNSHSENIMDLTTVSRRMDNAMAAGNNAYGKAVIRPAKSIFSIRSLVEVEEDGGVQQQHSSNNNHGEMQMQRNDSPSNMQGARAKLNSSALEVFADYYLGRFYWLRDQPGSK